MMKFAAIACVLAMASAASPIMNMGSHCQWGDAGQGGMTCTLPAHTSYDHAFSLVASMDKCDDNVASNKGCYNEQLCMFCFPHVDEYYLIEEAMATATPQCEAEATRNNLSCPSSADVHSWHKHGILNKVHDFWGARAIPMPQEFSN